MGINKEFGIFVKKIVILCGLVASVLFILTVLDVSFIGSQYQYSYNASLLDKMSRLESMDSPKIILVGNSNLAFGIDSEKIEEATGMPVVNLGYLASFGNEFNEKLIQNHVCEGDLVIVAHTNYADSNELGSIQAALVTMDCHPKLYPLMRFQDWIAILPAYPNYLRNAFILKATGRGNRDTQDSYSRTAFNAYGDVVRRVESSQMDPEIYFAENQQVLPDINDTCIDRLNAMNAYIEDCGGKMVVAAYPIAYGNYTPFDKSDITLFQTQLSNRLDCDIISTFTDYTYPYELFYDQIYHLTEDGVNVRTKQLIKDLKNTLLLENR